MNSFFLLLLLCLPLTVCDWTGHSRNDLAKTVSLVEYMGFSTPAQRADFVRNFVHKNSIHLIDEEYYSYASDTDKIISLLYDCASGSGQPPHLDCYTRSRAMEAILRAMGIKTRAIDVYSDDFDTLESHSFLEVYSPGENAWHVQDPDYNIYYIDSATKSRLSAMQLVFQPLEGSVPCRDDLKCGWKDLGLERIRDHYFELLVYDRRGVKGGKTVILVNQSRFDPAKRFSGKDNKTMSEFTERFYGRPIYVMNSELRSAPPSGD